MRDQQVASGHCAGVHQITTASSRCSSFPSSTSISRKMKLELNWLEEDDEDEDEDGEEEGEEEEA